MGLLTPKVPSDSLIGSDENKFLPDGTPNPAFVAGMTKDQFATAQNAPMSNPFSSSNFGANNPELQLIKDPADKLNMQRQSMFKGLGNAGAALLANSGKSTGEAFGIGAQAFQGGADAEMTKGLMMNEKRQAQIAAKAKQERMDDVKANLSVEDQRRFDVFADTDNKAGMAELMKKAEMEDLIAKVDTDQYYPASVQKFRKSVEQGKPDYGLLEWRDKDGKGGGSGSGGVSLYNALYAQAKGQYATVIDPKSGELMVLENDRPKMQELYTLAAKLIGTNQANLGNAISLAGEQLGISMTSEKPEGATDEKSTSSNWGDRKK